MKKSKISEKAWLWVAFSLLLLGAAVFIFFSVQEVLQTAGIKIESGEIFVIFFILTLIIGALKILNKLKFKINNYFIVAMALSLLVLFVGLAVFSRMYSIELPVNILPYVVESQLELMDAHGSTNVFFHPLYCVSLKNKKYLSQWDSLECNLKTNLNTSDFKLIEVSITKQFSNKSTSQPYYYACLTRDTCSFTLYLEDDSLGFSIVPLYTNETQKATYSYKLSPVFYYLGIPNLRKENELIGLEQNKITLLIAILTASFLTVWASVYYAKKILEDE